jgi:hypothetical protein
VTVHDENREGGVPVPLPQPRFPRGRSLGAL